MAKYLYYFDDKEKILVRYRGRVTIMTRRKPQWIVLERDNPYEREICLGQGYNCLTDLTLEEVMDILNKWFFEA